jgi:ADP-ribose pyrophosphatase YjhB (NUDIX family)
VDIEYVHLEHDGKLLLVNLDGRGPVKPQMGRTQSENGFSIRLPSITEVASMGIEWKLRRTNRIRLDSDEFVVNYGIPDIAWPEDWAWKDSVISDSAVDPLARESVYRTIHRVVSKVVIRNSNREVLMAKVSRGFFTGCWTLPGGFVDYGEHPKDAAIREAFEELGVEIQIPAANASNLETDNEDGAIVQTKIFNDEGITWVSFTYKCESDLIGQKIYPKDDEIEEARWFSKEEAMRVAVSEFDIEAINAYLG